MVELFIIMQWCSVGWTLKPNEITCVSLSSLTHCNDIQVVEHLNPMQRRSASWAMKGVCRFRLQTGVGQALTYQLQWFSCLILAKLKYQQAVQGWRWNLTSARRHGCNQVLIHNNTTRPSRISLKLVTVFLRRVLVITVSTHFSPLLRRSTRSRTNVYFI